MKLDRIIKAVIKYGPIIYPIVKKVLDSRSASKTSTTPRSTPKR